MNFIDKKASVKRAMSLLAKNGIQVDDAEASVILEFLYIIAKNYNKHRANQNAPDLKENSNLRKQLQSNFQFPFWTTLNKSLRIL